MIDDWTDCSGACEGPASRVNARRGEADQRVREVALAEAPRWIGAGRLTSSSAVRGDPRRTAVVRDGDFTAKRIPKGWRYGDNPDFEMSRFFPAPRCGRRAGQPRAARQTSMPRIASRSPEGSCFITKLTARPRYLLNSAIELAEHKDSRVSFTLSRLPSTLTKP